MKLEISKPHYHPGKSDIRKFTKKRDLSVPPNWVANEKVKYKHKYYAVVMPKREESLYEDRQALHIHLPEYVELKINGQRCLAKVKVHKERFEPVVHVDDVEAVTLGVVGGEEITL